nr:MAG TPA: hypothetical protein [Caudoviricetes sp.]
MRGNNPAAEAVKIHIAQNCRSCQAKIFLFWVLIFKTDADKIKITTGDGTQDGSCKSEREKNKILTARSSRTRCRKVWLFVFNSQKMTVLHNV